MTYGLLELTGLGVRRGKAVEIREVAVPGVDARHVGKTNCFLAVSQRVIIRGGQHPRQAGVCLEVAGFYFDSLPVVLDGFGGLSLLFEHVPQSTVGLEVFRVDFHSLPIGGEGLVGSAQHSHRDTKLEPGLTVFRLELESFSEALDRLRQLALVSQDDSPLVVGVGTVRLARQRLLYLLDRFIESPGLGKNGGQVPSGLLHVGVDLDSPLEVLDRPGVVFLPDVLGREVVMTLERVRVYLDQSDIVLNSLDGLSGA